MLKDKSTRFVIIFFSLFALFYYFNLFFIGITGEGGLFYSPFIDRHLNYIRWLREALIAVSAFVLSLFGYETIQYPYRLKLVGGVSVGIVYSCLAYGVMSFYAAFFVAFPVRWRYKWKVLVLGLLAINLLNVLRICAVLIAYSFFREPGEQLLDHHLLFNVVVYAIIALIIYFWSRTLSKIK